MCDCQKTKLRITSFAVPKALNDSKSDFANKKKDAPNGAPSMQVNILLYWYVLLSNCW